MKASIQWRQNASFEGKTGSGHTVIMDGPPDFGGQNLGPRPMEMMLLSLGGCSAFDVVLILKKSRQNIQDCTVEIEAQRAAEDPKVFTQINMHYTVIGEQLSEKQVARAVQLSAEKYCSASIMLSKSVYISHSYEIGAGKARGL